MVFLIVILIYLGVFFWFLIIVIFLSFLLERIDNFGDISDMLFNNFSEIDIIDKIPN